MEIFGVLFECVFCFIGWWIYRFSLGKIKFSPNKQQQMEALRRENQTILRFGGLAIMAIMVLEIGLHLIQWIGRR
jgi:hypothetical protein